MGLLASSHYSSLTDSTQASQTVARSLKESFLDHPLKAIVVYATVNHDQAAVLATLQSELGEGVKILGCSVQGVVTHGIVDEGAYALGVMGFGGSELRVAAGVALDIQVETKAKGAMLAESLTAGQPNPPKIVFLVYDPLCGADVDTFLSGFSPGISCPIVGGGASQPWGPIARTFQYWGSDVLGHSALALALDGPFSAEIGVCHGTSPTGVEMTLTRADGNKVLEIDGRPAIDIWREVTGCGNDDVNNQDYSSYWAMGVERGDAGPDGTGRTGYAIRAAFGFDISTGGVIVQAAIPVGTQIMFHHRTVPAVTRGTVDMGVALTAQLAGRRPWAVMGFECAARTQAFLGSEATLQENVQLQAEVAPTTPWLGMLAWGEVAPTAGVHSFHNFTYPLAVLVADS